MQSSYRKNTIWESIFYRPETQIISIIGLGWFKFLPKQNVFLQLADYVSFGIRHNCLLRKTKLLIFLVFLANNFHFCFAMVKHISLITEAKVWIKGKNGTSEIIHVMLDHYVGTKVIAYNLYNAFDEHAAYLGRILFDLNGYWIYDGSVMSIDEQEQLAKFIICHVKKHAAAVSDELR